MYNTDFSSQLDAFRNDLFGNNYADTKTLSDEVHLRYTLPQAIKLNPCEQNEHGEYVSVKLD
ncbi:hypothetical protein J4477_02995 [Candidatus Pacearchaeota archaeon]|nr:hypothetical protein [Candidatus Pacearchaeota archaeon]